MNLIEQITQVDGSISIGIQEHLNADWFTEAMKAVSFCGNGGWLFIVIGVVLLLIRRTRTTGFVVLCSMGLEFALCNLIIKPLVDRPRPWECFSEIIPLIPDPGDASFPSGHAAVAMAFAWALWYYTRKRSRDGRELFCVTGWKGANARREVLHRWGLVCIIFALIIGLSRLCLRVHFLSDVIAGLLLGMLCATVVCSIASRLLIDRVGEN